MYSKRTETALAAVSRLAEVFAGGTRLSAEDIAGAVGRYSVSTPAGLLEGGSEDLLLRFDTQRKSAAAFHDLVVISGDAVRAGGVREFDVARRFVGRLLAREQRKGQADGRYLNATNINSGRTNMSVLRPSAQGRWPTGRRPARPILDPRRVAATGRAPGACGSSG